MVSSLTSYLQDNKILNKTQHGFQCGKSVTTNLLECYSYIADVLNRGSSRDVILSDFQQAYSTRSIIAFYIVNCSQLASTVVTCVGS